MGKTKDTIIKPGRAFYAIAMAGIGFQLIFFGNFHPVIVPDWPTIPGRTFLAYITGLALMLTGASIITGKKGKIVSLISGGTILLLCFGHVLFEFIIDPNRKYHLGLWTNALKELALSGGAFVVAKTFSEGKQTIQEKSFLIKLLEKISAAGIIFFSIMLICFGTAHFLYMEGVSTLVPDWMPDHLLWTYVGGITLIGSGVAFILKIRVKTIGILLGSVLFFWFVFLHLPRSVANPLGDMGNELTSAFTALAFSGIAFVIAGDHFADKQEAG